MKYLYKYPQAACPYNLIVKTNEEAAFSWRLAKSGSLCFARDDNELWFFRKPLSRPFSDT
jgi:hypothetical protein